jgi:LacI family transcriptional regulator
MQQADGMTMTKRKQVAEIAGVSEATVSRVLSGVGPVREETRRRVLEAAAQLGYTPSAIARSFVLQRSENIGVILPVLPKVHLFSAYYYSEILSGIGHEVERRGYSMLVQFHQAGEEPRYESAFLKHKIDACIILGSKNSDEDLRALAKLHRGGYPFCIIGGRTPYPYSEVDADHISGSRQAIFHLLERGHRRIAFVNGPLVYSNSVDRLQGVRSALAEAGLDGQVLYYEGNYSRKSGYELAEQLYEARHEYDAIFAANDRMAIGLMQGLKERGMEAGRDYALVGYDDSDTARVADPPLTTVHVPFFEMGRISAARLLDLVGSGAEGADPFKELLEVELVVRRSS